LKYRDERKNEKKSCLLWIIFEILIFFALKMRMKMVFFKKE